MTFTTSPSSLSRNQPYASSASALAPTPETQGSFPDLFGLNPSTQAHEGATSKKTAVDELTKIFNSAVVSTRTDKNRDFSTELYQLVQMPSFSAILSAIRLLARSQGIPERAAAEQVIATFRKLDGVWTDYIFQEGVDRLREPGSSSG